jgi:hypothetical protein
MEVVGCAVTRRADQSDSRTSAGGIEKEKIP